MKAKLLDEYGIINALYHAAEVYRRDAANPSQHENLRAVFQQQAVDAEYTAQQLEAGRIQIK